MIAGTLVNLATKENEKGRVLTKSERSHDQSQGLQMIVLIKMKGHVLSTTTAKLFKDLLMVARLRQAFLRKTNFPQDISIRYIDLLKCEVTRCR